MATFNPQCDLLGKDATAEEIRNALDFFEQIQIHEKYSPSYQPHTVEISIAHYLEQLEMRIFKQQLMELHTI